MFGLDLFSLFIIVVVAGLLVVAFVVFQQRIVDSDSQSMMDEVFSKRLEALEETMESDSKDRSNFIVDYIDRKLLDRFPWIGIKCTHAEIAMPAALVATIGLAVALGVSVLATLILVPRVAPLLGFFIPFGSFGLVIGLELYLLESKIKQRISNFDEQFNVGLEVLAAAMRAGNTFMNGIKFIAQTMDPPLGREFGIVSTELGLGVEIPIVLDRFQERLPSKNLFLFITSVKVASQTGAALAPTFLVLARVIAERFRLQGLINISVSENIGAMMLLAGFPWFIVPFLMSSWPEAYDAFGKLIFGQIIMVALFLWYCFGIYQMYKLVTSIDT